MTKVFTISDIHGCAKTFIALVEKVIQLTENDQLFLLGDYIDRGPDSKGVIDYIIHLKQRGFNVTALRGNHEAMLLGSITDDSMLAMFVRNGGDKTLSQFGIQHPKDMPLHYLNFFNELGFYSRFEKYILVHAGINTNAAEPFEDRESMLWTRNFQVDGVIKENYVIHGHTPKPLPEIEKMVSEIEKNRKVDIDNGCVLKGKENLGNLCCLELGSLTLHYQPNIDW